MGTEAGPTAGDGPRGGLGPSLRWATPALQPQGWARLPQSHPFQPEASPGLLGPGEVVDTEDKRSVGVGATLTLSRLQLG